jgi:hypothetical protein
MWVTSPNVYFETGTPGNMNELTFARITNPKTQGDARLEK